jgi:hypothetical protein
LPKKDNPLYEQNTPVESKDSLNKLIAETAKKKYKNVKKKVETYDLGLDTLFKVPRMKFETHIDVNSYFIYGIPENMVTDSSHKFNSGVQGIAQSEIFQMPLKCTWSYGSPTANPQTQNYFKVEFDKPALQARNAAISDFKKKIADQLIEEYEEERVRTKERLLGQLKIPIKPNLLDDTLSWKPYTMTQNLLMDTMNIERPRFSRSGNLDLAEFQPELEYSKDSIADEFLAKSMDSLSKRLDGIEQLLSKLKEIKNLRTSKDMASKFPQTKSSHFLESIGAFQLGQTNPNFSAIAIARIPVNGIYFQLTNETKELSILHGQVCLTIPLSNDQKSKLFNQFAQDVIPTNKNIGDRVSAFSYAISKTKNSQHNLCFSYGLDKIYTNDSINKRFTTGNNVVLEFNGFWKRENSRLEYYIAQSGYSPARIAGEESTLFKSSYSNSWSGGLKNILKIKLLRSKVKLDAKYVGLDFVSLANPFLRGDQLKFNASMNSQITPKLNSTIVLARNYTGLQNRTVNSKSNVLCVIMNYTISNNWISNISVSKNDVEYWYNERKGWNANTNFNVNVSHSRNNGKLYVLSNFSSSCSTFNSDTISSSYFQSGYQLTLNQGKRNEFQHSSDFYSVSGSVDGWNGWNLVNSETVKLQFKKTSVQVTAKSIFSESHLRMGGSLGLKENFTQTFGLSVNAETVILEDFILPEYKVMASKQPFRISINALYHF